MRGILCVVVVLLGGVSPVCADLPTREQVAAALSAPILEPGTPLKEVQAFCEARVPRVPRNVDLKQWETLVSEWRSRTLNEVIFRGQAAEWRKLPTQVEWFETIEDAGPEYRIRKFRYQAVPGMFIPGLLYEPKQLSGKVPVMLAVNGHDANGKAADYKQIRCINLAKRGMLVANLEWINMGQLRSDDFGHYRMNQLDLVGTSGIAPFYLAMSRGLDVLLQHEHADPKRVAVSGLSGGGWQTIFISGLDERVTLANPVAGYSSFVTRSQYQSDLGDSEQTPCDMATVVDYTHLTAMRAPRPTLLTYNEYDNCCFAAPHALQPLVEVTRPAYRLYQAEDALASHVNYVPGTHNFERDNREALYRMLRHHFFKGQPFEPREITCDSEVQTAEKLKVDLPTENLGFGSLARQLTKKLPEVAPEISAEKIREQLRSVVRSNRDLAVSEVKELERVTWGDVTVRRLKLSLGLTSSSEKSTLWTVPAVVLSPASPTSCVLLVSDSGRATHSERVLTELQQGHSVVAVDPFFFGESKIQTHDFLYALLTAAVGQRPVGIQADQLIAIARWASSESKLPVSVRAEGRRLGVGATVAAAMAPETIQGLHVEGGFESLRQVLNEDLSVDKTPELFCFGLLETCDLPVIRRAIPSLAEKK